MSAVRFPAATAISAVVPRHMHPVYNWEIFPWAENRLLPEFDQLLSSTAELKNTWNLYPLHYTKDIRKVKI
jgi:hypothetical protein